MAVLLRSEKGSPLSHSEMDNNIAAVRALEALIAALGSMSGQNSDNVSITGGTIAGVPVANIALGGTAAGIVFVPTGNISSTDVQAAIAELDTEKQPISANLTEFAAVNPTAAGLALLDDADADAQLTTLGGTTVGKALFGAISVVAAQQAVDLEVGVDVQAYDVDTAKLDVAQPWTAQQTFKELKETVYTIDDTSNGGAFEIDPANGTVQKVVLTASRTPKATNFESGQSVILKVSDGTAYSLTWTDGTLNPTWVSGLAPTLATTGYTHVALWKDGDTMYGKHIGDTA